MESRLKTAFRAGAQDALSAYGLAPEREESTFHKALPWLAAGAAGLGAYKYLRTPTFASNPALRKIQQQAAEKGFHRLVDVTPYTLPEGAGLTSRLRHFAVPRVNARGELDKWNRLKLFLQEGTTEAIPYAQHLDGEYRVVGHKGPLNVQGVLHERPMRRSLREQVRGGIDVEGPHHAQKTLTRLSRSGKAVEADLLQRHAPEAIPETHTDVAHLFEGLPENRQQAVTALQDRVLAGHGKDFVLKPVDGLSSRGRFPHAKDDWATSLARYDEHMSVPANREHYDTLLHESGRNAATDYLTQNGLYEGHVLHHALKDPSSVMAQRWVDRPLGEYRVHTIAGAAPANLAGSRHLKGPLQLAKENLSGTAGARKFVEETLAKLPPEYQQGNFAVDVMPHLQEDGTVGYKILEMNPTRMGVGEQPGGDSGLLVSSIKPFAGHGHYRAVTGRRTPVSAGLGALGMGGAAALGTRVLTDDDEDE